MAAFVVIERRASSPITPLRLFADRNRASAYVARLFLVAGMFGMFFFLSQFLQNILGYSPIRTGLAFLPLTVMLFIASQSSSKVLIDRFGAKPLMVVGITFSAIGIAILTQISATSGYFMILAPLTLFGLGNGLAIVPLTTAALTGVDPRDAGAGSGLVNVMQQVGGALGLAVLVTVFGSASRHAASHAATGLSAKAVAAHAYVVGATRAFDVATVFLVVVLLLCIFAIRTVRPTGPATAGEDELEELERAGSVSAAG